MAHPNALPQPPATTLITHAPRAVRILPLPTAIIPTPSACGRLIIGCTSPQLRHVTSRSPTMFSRYGRPWHVTTFTTHHVTSDHHTLMLRTAVETPPNSQSRPSATLMLPTAVPSHHTDATDGRGTSPHTSVAPVHHTHAAGSRDTSPHCRHVRAPHSHPRDGRRTSPHIRPTSVHHTLMLWTATASHHSRSPH